jgi:hypothetical protein
VCPLAAPVNVGMRGLCRWGVWVCVEVVGLRGLSLLFFKERLVLQTGRKRSSDDVPAGALKPKSS